MDARPAQFARATADWDNFSAAQEWSFAAGELGRSVAPVYRLWWLGMCQMDTERYVWARATPEMLLAAGRDIPAELYGRLSGAAAYEGDLHEAERLGRAGIDAAGAAPHNADLCRFWVVFASTARNDLTGALEVARLEYADAVDRVAALAMVAWVEAIGYGWNTSLCRRVHSVDGVAGPSCHTVSS